MKRMKRPTLFREWSWKFLKAETLFLKLFDQEESFTATLSFLFGVILLCIGLIGVVSILINPVNIIGAFLYASIGVSFLLYGGREYLNHFIPSLYYNLLYGRKDVVELILHSNSLYQIIGVILYSITCIKSEIDESQSIQHPLTTSNDELIPISPRYVSLRCDSPSFPSNLPPPITNPPLLASPINDNRNQQLTAISAKPLNHDFYNYFISLQAAGGSPSNTVTLENKCLTLSELFLSCLWKIVMRQWDYHSKECFQWIMDQYNLQKKLLWKSMKDYLNEQFFRPIKLLPLIPLIKIEHTPIKAKMLQNMPSRNKDQLAIKCKQTRFLCQMQQLFVRFNNNRCHRQIPYFHTIERCFRLQETSNNHVERQAMVVILSYLLLNIIAFRLNTFPHKTQWLQVIILRGLMTREAQKTFSSLNIK